jgi:outer membrane lipoprotein-sorting protein
MPKVWPTASGEWNTMMNAVRMGVRTLAMLGFAAAFAHPAFAQTDNKAPATNWNPTNVTKAAPVTAIALDAKQTAALKEVDKYFNELKQMKGNFHQTNADGKHLRGKFFIKQPGRFRFDYGSGSKMIIVSNGKMLSIQDLDLKTDSSWELDRTPFRMLLRKDVDLIRDATILEAQEAEDLIILTLQDKDPDTVGKIKLFLVRKPTLELKEWVTTDPQGIDTRVEITDINKTDEIAMDVFTPVSPEILKLQQKQ